MVNTVLLLSRGATITWAHIALLNSDFEEAFGSIFYTIVLGLTFTLIQAYEYIHASFTITDSVYGSIFYLTTGFHGIHVNVGIIFIFVSLCRLYMGHFSCERHFGFEARA